MVGPLIPNAFWFRWCFSCAYGPETPGVDESSSPRLIELDENCRLPDLTSLRGHGAGSVVGEARRLDLRMAWNPRGLAIDMTRDLGAEPTLQAPGLGQLTPARQEVHIWIDTRDTRDVHRATRYCHRFQVVIPETLAQPSTARSKSSLGNELIQLEVEQRPIARALADAPTGAKESRIARVKHRPGGWRMSLILLAEALHGFDPDVNRRLGFFYLVTHAACPDVCPGIGRDFPVGEDPSLWPSLELSTQPPVELNPPSSGLRRTQPKRSRAKKV